MRVPAALDETLRAAILRFHGQRVEAEALAPWRTLLDTVYDDSRDMRMAWRAVCVGLITHPDFYSF